jgi:hypothetical protein
MFYYAIAKGHKTGIPLNELADTLANTAAHQQDLPMMKDT